MVENLQRHKRNSPNHARAQHIANGTTALGVVVVLGMLGLGIVELFEARCDAWKQAVDASDNITLALAEEIKRNVESYDLSLKGVISGLAIPGINDASHALRQAALFDTSSKAQYLGTILVIDKAGGIKWSSMPSKPAIVNFADQTYFTAMRDQPGHELYISKPFISRLGSEDPSIALVRRLDAADGSFDGIVQGVMHLKYFQDKFDKLNLGVRESITLSRTDGRILARWPLEMRYIDQDLSAERLYQSDTGAAHGHFQAKSPADGIERYYTFRRIGDLPLVLTNGISVEVVYQAWWSKAVRVGSILIFLSTIICALCLLFRQEIARRRGAETALSDAVDELALMANTDSLTGLANRRAFDTALDAEWRRALRSELPVALIMFDADHFKLFNDRYGHPEGDRILRAIAACIEAAIRRPADFAGRYGGEEFVVILPETERTGALTIAERIRSSVEALQIPHMGSPLGRVTVSAGVAWAIPNHATTKDMLLKQCDVALYRSKRICRNTVSIPVGRDLETIENVIPPIRRAHAI